jgi:hypothetical protein
MSIEIDVPVGAVAGDVSFSITDSGNGTNFGLSTSMGNGTALYVVNLAPEGLAFNDPVTICLSWLDEAPEDGTIDDTDIDESSVLITQNGDSLTERCRQEAGPIAITGAECDAVANYFCVAVDSFSEFALFEPNAPVFDQGHDSTGGGSASSAAIDSTTERAQTFTVGQAGVLDSIDLQVVREDEITTADLLFDIRGTAAGTPKRNPPTLVSLTIPASEVPLTLGPGEFFTVDVISSAIAVNPGEVLAIVLGAPDATTALNRFQWSNGPNPDDYFDGDPYSRTDGAWILESFDAGFQTLVIPEPSSSLSLLSGAGLLVLLARRRRVTLIS